MASCWLLDTSALLALRHNEAGAERVADLLRQARLADAQIQSLPIRWVAASDPLLEQAAAIKACHALSVADAWIAAAARQEGAVLVHKDPEFQAINSLAQEWLG